MPYKIPEERINEIKEATDIVELISGYLTLKKRGKSYFGLCPFHQEDTPSFSVDPTRQMYHCFGCHKGGNAITFLMEYEHMSFIEAVEFLADKAGITIRKFKIDDSVAQEKEALYFANKFAAEFFNKNLMAPIGSKALTYLHHRGFDNSLISKFGLGFALPEWDGLIKFAQQKSMSLEILYKAGLLIKRENGEYYDRFRGRVMIPVINLSKKVVGFGGRILVESDNTPKYINSPETPVYQKGQILFGLFHTRESIREQDQAIFVEGYTDLLSLYKYGITNVVATSGTSLTTRQAQLIKRYTDNIILLYDSDAAGSAAAMRGADIFLNAGLEIKIATLPAGHDPDSFIKAEGLEPFLQFLAEAVSVIQFKINKLSQQDNEQNPAKVIQTVLESVAKIKDNIKRSLAVKEIAEYYMIDERSLLQQLAMMKKVDYSAFRKPSITNQKIETKKNKYDIAEENLVKLMIMDDELVEPVVENITVEEIKNTTAREILKVIFDLYQKDKKIIEQNIVNAISEPKVSALLSQLLTSRFDEDIDLIKLLNDCIVSIKKRELEEQLQKVLKEIKVLQSRGDDVRELMEEYQEIKQEIIRLESKNFVITEKNA